MSKDLLSDFITYLVEEGIATGAGTDIFQDWMPDSPDNAICLAEYLGETSFIAKVDQRSIQVKVRNTSYENARAKIWSIYNLLYDPEDDIRFVDLTATRWVVIRPRCAPYHLTRDESDRNIFIFNMGVTTFRDE